MILVDANIPMCLVLAVMEQHGVRRIVSFDMDFDDDPGVERIKP